MCDAAALLLSRYTCPLLLHICFPSSVVPSQNTFKGRFHSSCSVHEQLFPYPPLGVSGSRPQHMLPQVFREEIFELTLPFLIFANVFLDLVQYTLRSLRVFRIDVWRKSDSAIIDGWDGGRIKQQSEPTKERWIGERMNCLNMRIRFSERWLTDLQGIKLSNFITLTSEKKLTKSNHLEN